MFCRLFCHQRAQRGFWNLNLSGVDLRQLRVFTWQHNIDIAAQQRRIRGKLGDQHFQAFSMLD